MIESFMYSGIGFLLAILSMFVVVPAVHGRAVRLTTRRLAGAIPSSVLEVVADKDSLRAEFAMATRRLETNLQQLTAKSASQLAELGRKDDAINRLKIELSELRAQMRAVEEDFAVKAARLHEAERIVSEKEAGLVKRIHELDKGSTLADAQKLEITNLKTQVGALKQQLNEATQRDLALHEVRRAMSEKEAELAKRMSELDQRSTLADAQKLEIITLKTKVEVLEQQLDEGSRELKAVENLRDVALHEAQRAMSEKEAELAERMRELDQRSTMANAQKHEIITLKTKVEVLEQQLDEGSRELKAVENRRDVALHEAQRAMSEKEAELAERMRELDQRSTMVDAQKLEIIALKTQVGAMGQQLDEATHELRAVENRRDVALHEAQRAMSEKEAELAERILALDQRSTLADAQKLEIITLKTRVEESKEQFDRATHELKTLEDGRATERVELEAANRKLMEEQSRFEDFHRRVNQLVDQLMAKSTEDKNLSRHTQELESQLVAQSRLLKENELELKNLRGEIANARKVEAGLRSEIDDQVSIATEDLRAEKAKLQAAFDRANGERVRLAYELANMKRQFEKIWAGGAAENSDVAA